MSLILHVAMLSSSGTVNEAADLIRSLREVDSAEVVRGHGGRQVVEVIPMDGISTSGMTRLIKEVMKPYDVIINHKPVSGIPPRH